MHVSYRFSGYTYICTCTSAIHQEREICYYYIILQNCNVGLHPGKKTTNIYIHMNVSIVIKYSEEWQFRSHMNVYMSVCPTY